MRRQKEDDAKWRPVCLSKQTMAKGIELMDDGRMMASSQNGYRCVQAAGSRAGGCVRGELKEDGENADNSDGEIFRS